VNAGWVLVLAPLIAAAADLTLSALLGFSLRTDVGVLLAAAVLGAAAPAFAAAFGLGVLWKAFGRGPLPFWSFAFAAALLPLSLLYGFRSVAANWWMLPVSTLLVAALGAVERRRKRPPARRWIVAAAALSTVAIGWAALPRLPGASGLAPASANFAPASSDSPNLLLIVLDTLKASHLGLHGYDRPTSPWLDAFAARSTVFERAVSSSSWTLPAHATLFTGLYARSHGAHFAASAPSGEAPSQVAGLGGFARARPLADGATTLAEIARGAGYETGAICANTGYLHRYFGLDQGFDTYIDALPNRGDVEPAGLWLTRSLFRSVRQRANVNTQVYPLASEVNELALRWLEPRRDRRFFLFLNYMDAHDPYTPLRGYRDLFPRSWPVPRADDAAIRSRRRAILPAEEQALKDAYDAEIRYLDDQLAALFSALDSRQLLDNTLVVVVGDHGESFGEHHDLGHGNGVYETELHIPLIVHEPGQEQGRRVAHRVHLADVFPTILEVLGLPEPDGGIEGASLFGGPRSLPVVARAERFAPLAEAYPQFYDFARAAIYGGRWKLIQRSDGRAELYDLDADPGEVSDLAADRPELVEALRAELTRFEAAVVPRFSTESAEPDAELVDRLRALGYAQ
jgi:arylsulfatase A-like enzyme